MKLTPSELEANQYQVQDRLVHTELIPFVREYMKKRTPSAIAYVLLNVVFFALSIYCIVADIGLTIDTGAKISRWALGLGAAFLMVPLHEFLHVMAYKSVGAVQTSYDANLKRFYFMAIADRFVANRKEFRVVALTPFVVISLLTTMAMVILHGTSWVLVGCGLLAAHASMCSGDFALLSYFDFHNDKDVVTYDDKAAGVSYFLAKEKGA